MRNYKSFIEEEIEKLSVGDLVLDVANKPTLFFIDKIFNSPSDGIRYGLNYASYPDFFHRWCHKEDLIKPSQDQLDEWKMKKDAEKYNL